MLIAAFGAENALVRVSLEVDLDEAERETVTYDPESQIALREQTITEQFVGGADNTAGVVGITDEILEGTPAIDANSDSDYLRNEQTSEYGVDRVRTVERNSSGDITRLSVAVVINDALDPAPDLAQVSELVGASVGLNLERGDVIAVEAITFDERFADDLEVAAPSEAPADPLALVAPYLGIGQTALAILLLVLVVLSLRKGVKSFTATLNQIKPEPADVIELDSGAVADTAAGETKGAGEATSEAKDSAVLELERGPVSANDVMHIIDQQPIEVAALLRSWADEAVHN